MRIYYWRWLRTACTHSVGLFDLWTGLVTAVAGVCDHIWPQAQIVTYAWQIPIWALAAVMAVRLLLAPYWMWQEANQLTAPEAPSAPSLEWFLPMQSADILGLHDLGLDLAAHLRSELLIGNLVGRGTPHYGTAGTPPSIIGRAEWQTLRLAGVDYSSASSSVGPMHSYDNLELAKPNRTTIDVSR